MKRLTKKEKEIRAEIRKDLKEKGVIPPDKKRLNRKKFIEEAKEEWRNAEAFLLLPYFKDAFGIIMGLTDKRLNISMEAIGAAKVIKLAIRMKQFEKMVEERGDTKYSVKELFEYAKDILEA